MSLRIQDTTYQNFQNEAKEVLRGKFITLTVYIGKKEKSKINYLKFTLKITKRIGN